MSFWVFFTGLTLGVFFGAFASRWAGPAPDSTLWMTGVAFLGSLAVVVL